MVNKDNFRNIDPYVPGDQPDFADMVKLNTNENPYPPAPAVLKAAEEFSAGRLKLYPPTDGGALRRELAAYHGISPENVFVGVGSDDVLAVIFQTCFNSGRKLFFPEISYSFYEVWAELYRVPYCKIPLKADFTIDPDDYIGKENGGIVIANPNAPTSMAMAAADIEKIIAANPDNVVVIDEAYVDFGGESVLELTKKYDNLIVVRTFSKSRSMAGLRIGYAIASKELIQAISDVKNSINSYTMNFPSIEVGKASLAEEEYFRTTIAKILKTRERLVKELSDLGFLTFPSSANFIFTTHKSVPAKTIFEELRKKHIFVRFFNKPLINNYLRITVGTDEEVDKLIAGLKEILNK
jgi:histidinol-phosphate aminotransferase